jgi:hypothetical protein
LYAQVTPDKEMQQAVRALTKEEQRALMPWLTQHGPFWDDARNHGPDDWIEWDGQIVTDSAVGEAAWCCLNGIERGLVSFNPSDWEFSPIPIDWVLAAGIKKTASVINYWELVAFESALQALPEPLATWGQLQDIATSRYIQLTFAGDAFKPLSGHPFVSSAAQRLLVILGILNRFKSCFDAKGQRTPEGQEIYQNYFVGKKGEGGRGALFTDSSESEKVEFEERLTFKHPQIAGKTIFCTWHGKIQTPQLRVHFSSPIRADEPIYIAYIGPKITKK